MRGGHPEFIPRNGWIRLKPPATTPVHHRATISASRDLTDSDRADDRDSRCQIPESRDSSGGRGVHGGCGGGFESNPAFRGMNSGWPPRIRPANRIHGPSGKSRHGARYPDFAGPFPHAALRTRRATFTATALHEWPWLSWLRCPGSGDPCPSVAVTNSRDLRAEQGDPVRCPEFPSGHVAFPDGPSIGYDVPCVTM